MSISELEEALARHLTAYGVEYTQGSHGPEIPDVLSTFHGAINGHPMRSDFFGPKAFEGGFYLVRMFDLRTKNEIGTACSQESFAHALDQLDWPNMLGALTH